MLMAFYRIRVLIRDSLCNVIIASSFYVCEVMF